MKEKKRLDVLLVDLGYFESREKAKRTIMAGVVYVDNLKMDKAGTPVASSAKIEVRQNICPYVGRGGFKLEKAINFFDINMKDKVAMDIGASTGGFTDCMLQNGAKKVYSVDVGYGQLDWKIRNDERVVNMERTNIRYVTEEQIPEKLDFISIDVSFISLRLVLPVAKSFLQTDGELVCLIKPQFEAGKDLVGKNGIVRDIGTHRLVLERVIRFAKSLGFCIKNITFSPIKGFKGNIEYLAYMSNSEECNENDIEELINNVLSESHNELNS